MGMPFNIHSIRGQSALVLKASSHLRDVKEDLQRVQARQSYLLHLDRQIQEVSNTRATIARFYGEMQSTEGADVNRNSPLAAGAKCSLANDVSMLQMSRTSMSSSLSSPQLSTST